MFNPLLKSSEKIEAFSTLATYLFHEILQQVFENTFCKKCDIIIFIWLIGGVHFILVRVFTL
jgi:hypothetical protein